MNRTLEAIRQRIRDRQAAGRMVPPVVEPAKEIAKAEEIQAEPVVEAEEPSYRDLQAKAKELDIPANQSADDLKAAIEEASE